MCKVERITTETNIAAALREEESSYAIDSDYPLFTHMLGTFCCHGGFALEVTARGDMEVDPHHLLEDTGYVLGKLFKKTIGCTTILRAGSFTFPMDDALATAAVDLSGRTFCSWNVTPREKTVNGIDIGVFREFFQGFCRGSKGNVHLLLLQGTDAHHSLEAVFKAFGRALAEALQPSPLMRSTKGVIDD